MDLSPKYVEAIEDAARMGRYIPAIGPLSRKLAEWGVFELAAADRGSPENQIPRAPTSKPIWKLTGLGRDEAVARFGGAFTQHECGLYLWSRSPIERCPQCKGKIAPNAPVRVGEVLRADPIVGAELRRRGAA